MSCEILEIPLFVGLHIGFLQISFYSTSLKEQSGLTGKYRSFEKSWGSKGSNAAQWSNKLPCKLCIGIRIHGSGYSQKSCPGHPTRHVSVPQQRWRDSQVTLGFSSKVVQDLDENGGGLHSSNHLETPQDKMKSLSSKCTASGCTGWTTKKTSGVMSTMDWQTTVC